MVIRLGVADPPIVCGIRLRHPVPPSRAAGFDLRFPLGWSAVRPAEGPYGAVLAAISDSDWGSEGEFEIGRFGAPKGHDFEIGGLMPPAMKRCTSQVVLLDGAV